MKKTIVAILLLAAAPAYAATLNVDFGDSSQVTAGNWNNIIVNTPVILSIPNMVDSTGAGTGIGISVSGFYPGSNQNGTTSPTGAAAIFDAQATRDNAFGHTGEFGGNPNAPFGTVALTGLNPALSYNFTFFGSRTGVTDNRETKYDVAGLNSAVSYLDAANNASNVATAGGIQPTAAGEIFIEVSAGPNNTNGSKFYYLGAMQVTAVPEPACLGLATVAVLGVLGAFRRRS